MKKITLIFAALPLSMLLFGQTNQGTVIEKDANKYGGILIENLAVEQVQSMSPTKNPSKDFIFYEGFETSPDPSNGILPDGWVQKRTTSLLDVPTTDAATPRWFRNEPGVYTFSTGGSAYVRTGVASMAIGYSALNYTWAISPEISIPTSSGNPIYLEYWRWYKNGVSGGTWYYSSYYVAVKSQSGTWTIVKSEPGQPDQQPQDINHFFDEAQLIPIDDYQGQTIQIAFIYWSDGLPHWQMAIDDVSIYEIPNVDFSINEWDVYPTFALIPGSEIEIAAKVVCNGLEGGQPNVYLKVNDVVVQTVQVSEVLEYGNFEVVELSYTPSEPGEYNIVITLDDDENNSNHTVSVDIIVYEHITFSEDFEHIDWTDPENPAVIFPPDGWNQTANERDWMAYTASPIFDLISARVGQMVGDPEAFMVTPPIELTDNATKLSFWKSGINNGLTINDVYTGHSTLIVKYSNQEWPVTVWEDLATISFETGNAIEYLEFSIAHLESATYHFAFATTSNFSYSSGGTTYYSHVILDNIQIFKVPVEPVTVTFEVKDAEEADILDAVITLNGVTNEAGDYEFEILPGTYEYFVAKEGYLTYFGTIEVADDMTETVVLVEGENPTFTVTFTVADSEENPVEDAVITFAGVEAEAGVYVFEDVEPGVYTYSVVKAGFYTVEGTLTVIDDDVTKAIVLTPVVGVGVNTFANLTAYPNPFRDEIRVSNASEVKRVVITNLIGQQVMDVRLADSVIPTSSLPQGVYLVTFFGSNGERTVKKMVKQ